MDEKVYSLLNVHWSLQPDLVVMDADTGNIILLNSEDAYIGKVGKCHCPIYFSYCLYFRHHIAALCKGEDAREGLE